ncbi:hypothetical protein KSP39_PZI012407 [Platanthera zijinensis]|uniref:Uncharacterized protein n=1 Tax=Platanthera zijinensis TaxID=2320716 RepID=A0AAP0BFP8_9ASPA
MRVVNKATNQKISRISWLNRQQRARAGVSLRWPTNAGGGMCGRRGHLQNLYPHPHAANGHNLLSFAASSSEFSSSSSAQPSSSSISAIRDIFAGAGGLSWCNIGASASSCWSWMISLSVFVTLVMSDTPALDLGLLLQLVFSIVASRWRSGLDKVKKL